MDFGKPIFDYVDMQVHASARGDALTLARHRGFIASRLLVSVIALALFPISVALNGVPDALEALILCWLATPMFVAMFLSRTGAYDHAQRLSALVLTGFGATIAFAAGGIATFAAVWLVLVPLEAAFTRSPRNVIFASALALAAAGLLTVFELQGVLPPARSSGNALGTISVILAAFYGTGLALAAQSTARTQAELFRGEQNRHQLLARQMTDAVTRHDHKGAIQFASPAAALMVGIPVPELLGRGLLDCVHLADRPAYLTTLADTAEFGHKRSAEFRIMRAAPAAQTIWVEMHCEPLDRASKTAPHYREVVAVMRDITLQKEQARIIENLRADIEQANAASSVLLSLVSRGELQKSRQLSDKPNNRVKSSA